MNALPSTGGGDHATTKLIKWQIEGVDPGFDHSAPLDAGGIIVEYMIAMPKQVSGLFDGLPPKAKEAIAKRDQ